MDLLALARWQFGITHRLPLVPRPFDAGPGVGPGRLLHRVVVGTLEGLCVRLVGQELQAVVQGFPLDAAGRRRHGPGGGPERHTTNHGGAAS